MTTERRRVMATYVRHPWGRIEWSTTPPRWREGRQKGNRRRSLALTDGQTSIRPDVASVWPRLSLAQVVGLDLAGREDVQTKFVWPDGSLRGVYGQITPSIPAYNPVESLIQLFHICQLYIHFLRSPSAEQIRMDVAFPPSVSLHRLVCLVLS